MSLELTSKEPQNKFKMREVNEHRVYEFEDFRLDADHLLLYRNGEQLALTPKVVETLLVLVESHGEVLSKDELMEIVWPKTTVEEGNLSQNLYLLRKVLGHADDGKPFIETLRGRGYRFNCDVRTSKRNEAIRENATSNDLSPAMPARRSHEVIRHGNVVALADWKETDIRVAREDTQEAVAPTQPPNKRRLLIGISAACLIVGAILLARFLLTGNNLLAEKNLVSEPFAEMELSRLTTSAKTTHAAIAPDGKYVAHTTADAEGDSLWVRHVGAPAGVRVAGPAPSEFVWVAFAPDGDSVYYVSLDRDKGDTALWRVPILGGPPAMVGYDVGPIGFSPDGKHITYVKADQDMTRLFVANADASGERSLSVRRQPEYFWGYWNAPAWSPDGKIIAVQIRLSDESGQYETIVGVSVENGSQTPLTSARWNFAGQPVWLAGGEGLLLTASESSNAPVQVWHIARATGRATRVTNDLDNYHDLSLTADQSRLVAVQDHAVSSIWVATAHEVAQARQITTEIGKITDMAWTPDGRIVYRSNAGGDGDIWVMNGDGSGAKQLTAGARASRGLAVSRDGRFIFFASDRGGRFNIWRIDADGSHLKQLTDDDDNFYPYPSPDGAWVVFQKEVLESRLWKVPTDGGESERLSDTRVVRPVVSADGRLVAYPFLDPTPHGSRWSIGVISIEGGSRLKQFDLPTTVMPAERVIRWSPDGLAIAFPNSPGGLSDIWLQPLDGGPARQLTNFKAEQIVSFDWSPDGKTLAVIRSVETSDVVLISDILQSK